MDRDMVNLIHYLYHRGAIPRRDAAEMLWCEADTLNPLEAIAALGSGSSDTVRISPEVVNVLKMIESQYRAMPKPDFALSFPLDDPPRSLGEDRLCFVVMPYSVPWFGAVKQTILTAAEACKFSAEVSADVAAPGAIVDQIWISIRRADAVVVDITGHNPNVYYELGLAHALGKETILLTQDSSSVPFDVRHARRITYSASDLKSLDVQLEAAFRAVSPRYKYEGPMPWF